jgi:hypothetical protein
LENFLDLFSKLGGLLAFYFRIIGVFGVFVNKRFLMGKYIRNLYISKSVNLEKDNENWL